MDKREYRKSLKRIEKELDSGSVQSLVDAVEKYEQVHFPIGLPSPAEAIKFRMEQMNYTQTDLAKLLGSRPRASEYLSGVRKPSKHDALKIHQEWHVPLICLIQ